MVTGVYGILNITSWPDVWRLLYNLGRTVDKLWLVFGDFNEVIHMSEKWGGRARPKKQMINFLRFLLPMS